MKHTIVPSVNIFFVDKDRVLLMRRQNTGWMDDRLGPPGGHVEKGETPIIAVIREVKEELGVELRPTDLEFGCVAARNTHPNEYVAYEFIVHGSDYPFSINEPEKCSELVWVNMNKLPDDVIDDFRQIIQEGIVGKKPYLEIGY